MSLGRVFDKEKTRKILDVMPDEMIVWKVVTDPKRSFIAGCYNGVLLSSLAMRDVWNSAFLMGRYMRGNVKKVPGDEIYYSYDAGINTNIGGTGFHAFVNRTGGEQLIEQYSHRACSHTMYLAWIVASVLVRKVDIVAMGREYEGGLCIRSSKITMPTYPNTDITKELGQIETPDVERVEELAGV